MENEIFGHDSEQFMASFVLILWVHPSYYLLAYPANIYLFKVTIETLKKGVKYAQSYNKNTRTTSVTYFASSSSVSIVDFEQLNVSWVGTLEKGAKYVQS